MQGCNCHWATLQPIGFMPHPHFVKHDKTPPSIYDQKQTSFVEKYPPTNPPLGRRCEPALIQWKKGLGWPGGGVEFYPVRARTRGRSAETVARDEGQEMQGQNGEGRLHGGEMAQHGSSKNTTQKKCKKRKVACKILSLVVPPGALFHWKGLRKYSAPLENFFHCTYK